MPRKSNNKDGKIMKNKVNILGIEFEDISRQEVYDRIVYKIDKKEYTAIFTPNPEIALKAKKDEELSRIINSADILLPDGIGIIIASRILKTPLKERITGIDTAEFILDLANEKAMRVFLLGGNNGVAEKAVERLSSKYKNIKFCGYHHGYFLKDGEENEAVVKYINAAAPEILFVCFGCPAQEKWIAENAKKIPSLLISVGVGGSIDIWSGNIMRAPNIIRRLYLEWAWRIILQPRRIKSLFNILAFMRKVIAQALSSQGVSEQKNSE